MLVLKIGVDGVPGRAGDVGDDHALHAEDAVEQAGLADVRLAHDGDLHRVVLRLLQGVVGQVRRHKVQQIARSVAVDGGDLQRVTQTQIVEFVDLRVDRADRVAFVDGHDHRLAAALEQIGNVQIRRGHADLDVCDHNDDLCGLNGDLGLPPHEFEHLGLLRRLDAAGVDQLKGFSVPLAFAVDTVAGDARRILHDGGAVTGQLVEQHGLAHVGPAHDGNVML